VVVLVSPRDRECVLDAVKQRVPLLLDPPPAAVVIDLSGMTCLTSEAVAALLWAGAACRKRGVPVRLRHVPQGCATTLTTTGLSHSLALGEAEP
jgi:ABC-type transporter Mla MlaB component